jgi:uncharacterized Zn-binding protein involved in type VI secretion
MPKAALRGGDPTNHGGIVVPATCSKNVFIGGLPAATVASKHSCPMATPGSPPIPHGIGAAVSPGVASVLINGAPALGTGDKFFCAASAPAEAVMGSPNVSFEAGPTEYKSKIRDINAPANKGSSNSRMTVKDFADILKKVEDQDGYNAARDYAGNNIDYMKICGLAKSFVNGEDTNSDNDPCVMPSRFMLLYGADDGKLRGRGNIDDHPDKFSGGDDHKINVDNLRKGLILLGYSDIEESGSFDDGVYHALLRHLRRYRPVNPNGVGANKYSPLCETSHATDNDPIKKRCAEKGDDCKRYKPGVCYHYPWVPFSVEVTLSCGHGEDEDHPDKEALYEIFDRKTGELLSEGNFNCPSEKIEALLPDAEDVALFVDGAEMDVRPSDTL